MPISSSVGWLEEERNPAMVTTGQARLSTPRSNDFPVAAYSNHKECSPMNDAAISRQIGRNIRQLRTLAGWSQNQLASKIGITFQQVQKYEAGHNNINVLRLIQFQRAFSCNLADFFAGIDEPRTLVTETSRKNLTMRFCRAFGAIPDKDLQDLIAGLVQMLASEQP